MGPLDKVLGNVMGSMDEMNGELSERLDTLIALLTELVEIERAKDGE